MTTKAKATPRKRTAAPQAEPVEYVPVGSAPVKNGDRPSTHARTKAAPVLSPNVGIHCPDCRGIIGSHHDEGCAYKKRSEAYNADLKDRLARADALADAARAAQGKTTTEDRERRAAEKQARAARPTNGKRPAYHPVQPDDPNAKAPTCKKCGVPVEPSTKRNSSGWRHVPGTWDASWQALRTSE